MENISGSLHLGNSKVKEFVRLANGRFHLVFHTDSLNPATFMVQSRAIFKVQAAIIEGFQNWLNANGFLQVFTPCIMGVASESGSEVFEINYYKEKLSLLYQDKH